jgi:hypothetical protein
MRNIIWQSYGSIAFYINALGNTRCNPKENPNQWAFLFIILFMVLTTKSYDSEIAYLQLLQCHSLFQQELLGGKIWPRYALIRDV